MSNPTKHVKLPNEILLMISEFCSFRTLKSLRLSSRIFDNSNIISQIFQTVYLAPYEHSIVNLTRISTSSKIRDAVQKIISCGAHLRSMSFERWNETIALEALNHFEDGEGFLEAYERFPRVGEPTYSESTLRGRDLQRHYQKYTDMVRQQSEFTSTAQKYMLHDAVGKLQSLQSVEMEDGFDLRLKNDSSPPWLNLWSEILILPQFDLRTKIKDYSPPFDFIKDALTRGSLNPQCLKLVSCEANSFPTYRGQCSLGNEHERLFTNLQLLDLSIRGFAVYGQRVESMLNFGRISDQLKISTKLKRLKLHVRDELCFLSFPQFGNLSLPELEDLEISFCFKQDSLLRFLANHRKTLKRLTLESASLMVKAGGSWPELLEKIPQILKLTDVELRGLWTLPMTLDDPDREVFQRMVSDKVWIAEYKRFVINGDIAPIFDANQWSAMDLGPGESAYNRFLRLFPDQSYIAEAIQEQEATQENAIRERACLELDRIRNREFIEAGEADTESDIDEGE